VLQVKFSTGVRLRELRSIALVLATPSGLPPPSREAQRRSGMVLAWFREHWAVLLPLLPSVHLCDAQGNPINSARELSDR
jgi:hypothetical protein